MKTKCVIALSSILLFSGVTQVTHAGTIFKDSFESGDLSATDADGFKWISSVNTSVVNSTTELYGNSQVVNNTKANATVFPGGDWTPHPGSGSNSYRFAYAANNNWVESRFDFGKGYPEIWVSYWIRVPVNYYRTTPASGNQNNKWFNIQMAPMSQYEDTTVSRIEMQDWPDPSTDGACKLNIQFRNGTNGQFTNSNSYASFITPADAGKWMQMVYYLKASSSTTATDGIIRVYRRWDGQTDFTLINQLANLNVGIGAGSVSSGRLGWTAGYLMGWANAKYAQNTEWLIDDFTISDSPLVTNISKEASPPSIDTIIKQ